MVQENVGKRFDGYQIYDRHYEKVGKVEDLFVDENDVPEYIGVKTSLFGGPSALIPMDIVRVNDVRQLVEVASDKDTIEKAPSFDDDAEITAEFEERVYAHFGATRESPLAGRGGYGAYHDEIADDVDVAYGERSRAPESDITAPATPAGYEYPAGDREAAGPPSPTGNWPFFLVALLVHSGQMHGWCLEHNDSQHLCQVLPPLFEHYPQVRRFHLIWDNGPSHLAEYTHRCLRQYGHRVRVLFTPVHAS
jgi:hypothetical protein